LRIGAVARADDAARVHGAGDDLQRYGVALAHLFVDEIEQSDDAAIFVGAKPPPCNTRPISVVLTVSLAVALMARSRAKK